MTLNPYSIKNQAANSLLRNNSAHTFLVKENRYPKVNLKPLRESEIACNNEFDCIGRNSINKLRIDNNSGIEDDFNKNDIFGITLTKNDNFVVSEENDVLKNSLSFGKKWSIQHSLQTNPSEFETDKFKI